MQDNKKINTGIGEYVDGDKIVEKKITTIENKSEPTNEVDGINLNYKYKLLFPRSIGGKEFRMIELDFDKIDGNIMDQASMFTNNQELAKHMLAQQSNTFSDQFIKQLISIMIGINFFDFNSFNGLDSMAMVGSVRDFLSDVVFRAMNQ